MNNTSDNSSATDNFVTYSEDELSGPSRTDWARVDALTEDEIDTSDIPALTDEVLARMQWRFPAPLRSENKKLEVTVEVSIDADTLAWFRSQGQDCSQRMRAALRLYAEAHRTYV